MALLFQPKTRDVVMCNFSGFIEPEMVKIRPVIVIARNRYNNKLVTVVPISTTEPIPARECHHQLSINPLPDKVHITCWAKCDMVATVSIGRLDRYKLITMAGREYVVPSIGAEDYDFIKKALLCGLGMRHLTL